MTFHANVPRSPPPELSERSFAACSASNRASLPANCSTRAVAWASSFLATRSRSTALASFVANDENAPPTGEES